MAGPTKPFLANAIIYDLDNLSNSSFEYYLGSKQIPPLAPPNGIFIAAFLNVIKEARA